jgi:hypothetical protein
MLPPELSKPYLLCEHEKAVVELIKRLQRGIPPNEISHLSREPASFQEIMSSAWAYKMGQIANKPSWGGADDFGLLFRLVLKGCENSFVHSKWGKEIAKIDEHTVQEKP